MKHASKIQQVELGLTALAALGSGYGLGFWWAYEPLPRCGEQSIKQSLGNIAVWTKARQIILGAREHTYQYTFLWSQKDLEHLLAVRNSTAQILPRGSFGETSVSGIAAPSASQSRLKGCKRRSVSVRQHPPNSRGKRRPAGSQQSCGPIWRP